MSSATPLACARRWIGNAGVLAPQGVSSSARTSVSAWPRASGHIPAVLACALLGSAAALRAQSPRTDEASPDRGLKDFSAVPASAAAGAKVMGAVLPALLAAAALGALFYFVPTAVALLRGHPKIGPITIVNLLLGWTLAGWAVALAWALSAQEALDGRCDEGFP